jgi:hypothetical protein
METETATCQYSYCVPRRRLKQIIFPSSYPDSSRVKPFSLNCLCSDELNENSSKLSNLCCCGLGRAGVSASMG